MDRKGGGTGYRVISAVFWTDVAVAVAVETCHGLFAEGAEGFLEDWMGNFVNNLLGFWKIGIYH